MVGQESMVVALQTGSAGLVGLFAQAPEQSSRAPWWLFWLLIILGLLAVLIWWWSSRGREEPAAARDVTPAPVKPEAIQASPLHAAAIPTAPVATEDETAVLLPEREVTFEAEEPEVVEIEPPEAVEMERVAEVEIEPPEAVEMEQFDEVEIEPPEAVEMERFDEVEIEPPEAVEMERLAEVEIEPPEAVEMEPPVPDDLTRIEGIGPKISRVLQAAGITTYRQLAQTEVSRLEEILRADRNLKLANPGSWPEQARLAAAGDWQGLQALQNTLRAGREIS